MQDKLSILPLLANMESALPRVTEDVRTTVEEYIKKGKQEIEKLLKDIKEIQNLIDNMELIEKIKAHSVNDEQHDAEFAMDGQDDSDLDSDSTTVVLTDTATKEEDVGSMTSDPDSLFTDSEFIPLGERLLKMQLEDAKRESVATKEAKRGRGRPRKILGKTLEDMSEAVAEFVDCT